MDDCEEELFLGPEVVVDGREIRARLRCDRAQRGRGVAVLGEEALGGIEEFFRESFQTFV